MKLLVYTISFISAYLGWWLLGSVASMRLVLDQLNNSYADSLIWKSSGWFPAALLFILAILIVGADLAKKHKALPYIATIALVASFVTIRVYPEILLHLMMPYEAD